MNLTITVLPVVRPCYRCRRFSVMNLTITDTDAPALADALDAAAVSLRRDADRCDRRALSSRWGDVQAALSEHALELRERAAAFQGYVHQLRRNGPA